MEKTTEEFIKAVDSSDDDSIVLIASGLLNALCCRIKDREYNKPELKIHKEELKKPKLPSEEDFVQSVKKRLPGNLWRSGTPEYLVSIAYRQFLLILDGKE